MTIVRICLLTVFATWFALLYTCVNQARAQDLTMLDALQHGKDTQRLPPWLTLDDNVSLKWQGGRLYGCFTDRTTGNRWTSWAGASTAQGYMLSSGWRFGTGVATTWADQRVCWPDLPETPPVTGPKAIGEPAYLHLICVDACGPGGPYDWAAMNAGLIVGTTVVGEPCGDPIGDGFHTLPRLQGAAGVKSKDLVPVTRCAP